MPYRSILVPVNGAHGSEARVVAAANLALEHDASLTGVFLRSELMPGYFVSEGIVTSAEAVEAFFRESEAKTARSYEAAKSTFERGLAASGCKGVWQALNGDTPDALVNLARRFDLTIMPHKLKIAPEGKDILADQVSMGSGGPVLVFPNVGCPLSFGRKILVAWKDSREAARALRDSWPFLTSAEEVHVLTAIRDGERALDESLERHLHEHGCKTSRLIIDRDTHMPTSEIIRRHINMLGADMVVMGLFGHSRLREYVMGGVSRDMLTYASVPILVSH